MHSGKLKNLSDFPPQALDSASSASVSLNSINLRHVTGPRKTPRPPVSLRAKTFLIPCMSTRLIPPSALHTSSVQTWAQNANRSPSRRRWKRLQTNKGEPRERKTEREVDAGDQEAEDNEGIEKKTKQKNKKEKPHKSVATSCTSKL